MRRLNLDRIAIEEAGSRPERLAGAIHAQLSDLTGPVPVVEIALALDIEEIREVPLKSFEGALITPPEKGYGAIVVNSRSSPQRRRYTVGHELGHFLNPWHWPTNATGFECTRADMAISSGQGHHRRQEAEANRFAIELLAPASRLAPYLSGSADLDQALALAADFDISKAAAVRRYVSVHEATLAVIFSRNDVVLYTDRGREFPVLSVWKGDRLPDLPRVRNGAALSLMEEADPADWLHDRGDQTLCAQVLQQSDGYAITLLYVEALESYDGEDYFSALPNFTRGR